MVRGAGDRNAPFEAGATDRQIAQAATHEAGHLVAAAGRQDEVRLLLVQSEKRLLPLTEFEEKGRLAHPRHRRTRGCQFRPIRQGGQLRLVVEGFVAHRVPALVMAQVNLPRRLQPFPQLGAGDFVPVLGGADEVVERGAHFQRHVTKIRRHLVREGLRIEPGIRGGAFDLLPVLVRAGEEEHVVAVQPLEPRHHVGGDRCVSVADMRRPVHVIDRRRDVITLGHDNACTGSVNMASAAMIA